MYDDTPQMPHPPKPFPVPHYYGDTTRRIFLAMAIVMLVATPFLQHELPLPWFYAVLGIIVLALVAGFTSPRHRLVVAIDFIVSLVSVFIFFQQAIFSYKNGSSTLFFWGSLLLAVLAIVALYYSAKSLRAKILH